MQLPVGMTLPWHASIPGVGLSDTELCSSWGIPAVEWVMLTATALKARVVMAFNLAAQVVQTEHDTTLHREHPAASHAVSTWPRDMGC